MNGPRSRAASVYRLTDRRLIITTGLRSRSETSYRLDQIPRSRLSYGAGPAAVTFDADLGRPERPLFARSSMSMSFRVLTGHDTYGDSLGILRLPPAPPPLLGLADACAVARRIERAQPAYPALEPLPSYALARQPGRAEAGAWTGRVGDEVVWIGAPDPKGSPSKAKKPGRTTYLVTRRHAVVITRRGRRTHTKAVRLDRTLPPGIDDHGTVWLPSAEPRATLVAAIALTSTMRQRRKAKQLRFTGLADAQRVHDIIIAAQSRLAPLSGCRR